MSTTQDVADRLIRNDHFVEEYKDNFSKGYEYEYERFLRRMRRIVQAEFGRKLTVSRQNEIKREIQDEIDQFLEKLRELSEEELLTFQEVYQKSLNDTVHRIDSRFAMSDDFVPVRGYMSKRHPIDHGKVVNINSMITSIGVTLYDDLTDIITRMGLIEEDNQVLGQYYENAVQKGRNNLNSVSLTTVALVASFIKDAYFTRNRSIIGHQHISVLDAATTDICQFRHAKVWYYEDRLASLSTLPDAATSPHHFRCRSQEVPIFRGEDPAIEENYSEWFERQDTETKKEILGPTRYKMYQEQNLSIQTFKDVQGNTLTLSELRNKLA